MDNTNTNNSSTNNTHTNEDQAHNDAMKQFYVIITIVFIVLVIFLGFFIYNLIKCYLPKWRNQRELVNENETEKNGRRIEFEEI